MTEFGFAEGGGSRADKPLMEPLEKPRCQLVGTDGNVFAIIGAVSKTLKRAGLPERAKEFTERATSAKSYDEVLQMLHDYVEPY